jgi:hypothetical protein
MAIDVDRELAALKRLTAGALRDRYAEVFGEATTSGFTAPSLLHLRAVSRRGTVRSSRASPTS